jgi:cell division protein FtsB
MQQYVISQKITALPEFSRISLKFFWIFNLVLIPILLLFCIFQLNSYAEKNYLLQKYEKQLEQLSKENKILEINFSKANSFENIDKFLKNQNFKKIGKIEYIKVLENAVVAKPR